LIGTVVNVLAFKNTAIEINGIVNADKIYGFDLYRGVLLGLTVVETLIEVTSIVMAGVY
jgi:hypothetical protein